ncbi:hypothetical protein DXG01_011071, partial [Tephrocybe rancida]
MEVPYLAPPTITQQLRTTMATTYRLLDSNAATMKKPLKKVNCQTRFQTPQLIHTLSPDTIVCIDACFTQKRNRQARDPPRTHPCTVFIPEQDAEAMEKYVDFIRSKKMPAMKRMNTDEPDHLEGSLRVPKSVLDGCEAGFTAADSRREKASTQFFDDTALMALLCQHDVVLFIANMRSAGEKQHYVLVLMETLFQHLPLPYRVGLL